jgi:hypothetical protein
MSSCLALLEGPALTDAADLHAIFALYQTENNFILILTFI